jgi:hypothetical protein
MEGILDNMQELIVSASGIIRFPASVGITGTVFKEKQTIYYNDLNLGRNIQFQPDVDNTPAIETIRNMAFFPIIREDGE